MGTARFKNRINLATKFNFLTISLILVTSVGISLFMVRLEMKNSYRDLVNHGKTIADTTARNCELGIYTENQVSLLSVLEGLSADTDIAYVSVLNRERRTLASYSVKRSGVIPAEPETFGLVSSDAADQTRVRIQDNFDKRNGERYTEIFWPVMSAADFFNADSPANVATTVIGYLRLGLSHDGLQDRVRQLLISAVVFTTVLALIGIGLTIFLTRRITSPLNWLTAAAQDFSEGKFDSPVTIRTNDEIADLARSFDAMRGRLREFHDQVEKNTADLTATNEHLLQEIIARKAAEEQLQYDALHDSLTKLPNRVLFMDRLTHAMSMAERRKDYIFSVFFVDVDRFKVINDSLGHIIGDQLLIAVGQRLQTCLRPGDTVARLGGDEFALLLEDISGLGNATFIAERIGTSMVSPFVVADHEVFATVSIGIALSAGEYTNPDEVLRDADTAMYHAKSAGRAQYMVFEPGMHTYAVERMRLETDLRRAIERKELIVFYQPILSLTSNTIVGFEALARWQHPTRGLLNMGEFMKMADETGMIVSIDRLVLREACRQLREWLTHYSGNGLVFISANLSNKQMVQPDLVDYIEQVLKETGLKAECLKLEITENVILENPEETIAMLGLLKKLGVQLYIDDFGTGYSSLSYLHRLPIDGLKIDRSFISRLGEHGENQEIIRTIMLLARDMDIDVIAEGVETINQIAQIKLLGCEYGQGFLFSRPVDGERARALLESTRNAQTGWNTQL